MMCANVRSAIAHLCIDHVKVYQGISGLVVENIVAIDVTRARFPADACCRPAPHITAKVLVFPMQCALPWV